MGVLTAGQAQALTISIYNLFSFGSSKYRTYLADQPISWTQARNYALSLGASYDLVSINSTEENTAILKPNRPNILRYIVGNRYLVLWWRGILDRSVDWAVSTAWQHRTCRQLAVG